jgi:hypothetical protein
MAKAKAQNEIIFKFRDEIADKHLIHSMQHAQFELKGAGTFGCTPLEWQEVFSRIQISQLEGETEVLIKAFELVGEPTEHHEEE